MDDTKWLFERKKGIGGSDVAAILGFSRFKTALDVYNDKISDSVEQIENSAMRFGKILEPIIRNEYVEKTGEELIDIPRFFNKDFMIASLDGMTKSGKILEVKTARSDHDWGEEGTGEIPIYYTTQIQHYMFVTGSKLCDVAVLFGGSDFRIYTVEENKELQEIIYKKELEFWNNVKSKITPEPANISDIENLYPASLKSAIEANSDISEKIGNLLSINSHLKELEQKSDKLKFEIKCFMQDHDGITIDGKPIITYKSSKSRSVTNWQSIVSNLSEKYSEVVDLIKTNTSEINGSRRFLIK